MSIYLVPFIVDKV